MSITQENDLNTDLLNCVESVRKALHTQTGGLMIGCLPPGQSTSMEIPKVQDYLDWVSVTDGADCGEASFYFGKDLIDHQWFCEELEGGSQTWAVIEKFDIWKIILNKLNGCVILIHPLENIKASRHRYPRLNDFLGALFDERYLELNRDYKDGWYELLEQLHIV